MIWLKGLFVILVSVILISSGIINFNPSALADETSKKNESPNNNNNFQENLEVILQSQTGKGPPIEIPKAPPKTKSNLDDQKPISIESDDSKDPFQKLTEKAKTEGMVRIIVGLNTPFQPEGKFSTIQDKMNQRANIQNDQDKLLKTIPSDGIEKSHKFKNIPFMAMTVNANALENLKDSSMVKSIEEDVAVPATLSISTGIVGANPVAFSWGYTGQGQTVVIADTGVESTHEFVSGKVVAEACFSTDGQGVQTFCPNGQEQQIGPGAAIPCNKNGCYHGTHVAGIAAGNGDGLSAAPTSGVAKFANIIAIQVFSWIPGCGVCSFTSDQIDALLHVASLKDSYDISSVNLSLGGGGYVSEAQCDAANPARLAAVETLRSVGIATIASSGNSGFVNGMGAPACLSNVVSVGSTTKSDTISGFSNIADFLDLLAPGSFITSSLPSNTYGDLSGTSMSAPHVTGAWAVLKQFDPTATIDEVLLALINTGVIIIDNREPCGICPTNEPTPRIQIDQAIIDLDDIRPQTAIDSSDDGTLDPVSDGGITNSDSIDFGFSATDNLLESNLSFECSLDAAAFSSCSNSYSANSLTDGPHTFDVRATDEAGNTDQTPASFSWRTVANSPPYITNLVDVYNSRAGLQMTFPETSDGDFARIFTWAGLNGVTKHQELLLKYDHVYDLMRVYDRRAGLQNTFPEATNGEDLSALFQWAGKNGVNSEPDALLKFHHNYDLLQVYHNRPDLQIVFPEAENGVDLSNLFEWAGRHGWKLHSDPLDPHDPIYDLMRVYDKRAGLPLAFPEAENAIELSGLYCWAQNHIIRKGVSADPLLVPHEAFYDSQCP